MQEPWCHSHDFAEGMAHAGERRTRLVLGLTIITMVAEIVAGTVTNSMALLADGWHMGTHAGAMAIAVFAYGFARRHARDPRFTFGTGKVTALAGFTSAVILALVSLLMGWESLDRLLHPGAIAFDEAILVAAIGLVVNLVSAWLLGDHGHDHHHGHDHDHDHHHEHHHDHNLRGAYLHVLADALTSVLAIAALVVGKYAGWTWLDPAMGVVGGLVIARWSWGLLRDTAAILLDSPEIGTLPETIMREIGAMGGTVTDLHVWWLAPGRHAAIVAVMSDQPLTPEAYKAKLHGLGLAHVTVEVNPT